jgi:polar amino acid transport system substrate-binding protein
MTFMTFTRPSLFIGMLLSLLLLSACGKRGTTNPSRAADLLADVKKRGKLVISTEADLKPHSFKNPDGSFDGFDVQIGREVARRLGVKAEFLHFDWTMITAGSWNGRWDMNAGGMTPTPNRKKSLYFSSPYSYSPHVFLVHKNNKAASIEDLKGRKIGVGGATTGQHYLENKLMLEDGQRIKPPPDGVEVKIMSDQDALTDLALGDGTRLDAVLVGWQMAQNAIDGGLPLKMLGDPFLYADSALAFDRKSPLDSQTLVNAVSTIIADMHKDGTLSGLSNKYFGSDLSIKK